MDSTIIKDTDLRLMVNESRINVIRVQRKLLQANGFPLYCIKNYERRGGGDGGGGAWAETAAGAAGMKVKGII